MVNDSFPHRNPHPQSRDTVTVTTAQPLFQQDETTVEFSVEDWWDRLTGGSWMFADDDPAALNYAMRSAGGLPLDNEVLYGKTKDGLGHLVHAPEIVAGGGA